MKAPLLASLLCGALAFALHANSLNGSFLFDDKPLVLHNPLIRSVSSIPRLFVSNYWAQTPYEKEVLLYRPITMTSFALDHSVWKDNPFGYHLTNVVVHALVTVLVWWMVWEALASFWLATLSSALFAVHAVHTEAVNMIVGRTELLAAAGVLGAGWLWLRGKDRLSAAVLLLALLSKESAATLPVLLGLYVVWKRQPWRRLVFPALAVLCYAGVRSLVLGGIVSSGQSGILSRLDLSTRLWTMVKAFGYYVGLLVAPVRLSPDYPDFILATTLWDPSVLAALGGIGVIVLVSLVNRQRQPGLVMGVGWTAITLLPVSNIIPIGAIIGERFLYLPSVGWCLALASFPLAVRARALQRIAAAVLVGLGCWWAGLSWQRNGEWRSDDALWSATYREYPTNVKAAYHLAEMAFERQAYDRAEALYRQAIVVDPHHVWNANRRSLADVHYKLGMIHQIRGRYPEAGDEYQTSLTFDPDPVEVRYAYQLVRGLHLASEKRYGEAIAAYQDAIAVDPARSDAHYNLGLAHLKLEQPDKAIGPFQRALSLDPRSVDAHINLGNAFAFLGRHRDAETAYEAALRLDPHSSIAKKNLETVQRAPGHRPR